MAEFKKPSPEMEAVYLQIVALTSEGVWVPGVGNGGLCQLLAELEKRGWKVIPPDGNTAETLLTRLVSEAAAPQFGVNQDISRSFWTAWSEAKKFLSK